MASTRPRLWRLQFSLRTLLATMLLTSVALVLFRWPSYVIRPKLSDDRGRQGVAVVTNRRAWNGKFAREREVTLFLQDRYGIDTRLAADKVIAARHYEYGQLITELRQGKLHAVETLAQAHDTISGVWEWGHNFDGQVVQERAPWRNCERHGLSTWKNPSGGELLQSAEFERGRLIRWNGQSIDTAIRQWLQMHVTNEPERQTLMQPLSGQAEYYHYERHFAAYFWRNHQFLLVHYCSPSKDQVLKPPQWQPSFAGRPMVEVLLEGALNQSSTLDYRYGRVCVVPICQRELNWKDPTGCDKITFSDPKLQREWEANSAPYELLIEQPAQHLKMICNDTRLQLDTAQVEQLDGKPKSKASLVAPAEPRKFLFARILNAVGYRVELRDEILVVLPPRK